MYVMKKYEKYDMIWYEVWYDVAINKRRRRMKRLGFCARIKAECANKSN
jgi:hypothetical protein